MPGMSKKAFHKYNQRLEDAMGELYDLPLEFVMFNWDWGNDEEIQQVDWQAEDIFVDPKTGFVYTDAEDIPKQISVITYKEWMRPYSERFDSRYGPDRWACEFLDNLGEEIRKRGFADVMQAVDPVLYSTVSGHGIGKTCLVAWLVIFIMSTRPLSRGTVTANTDTQLRTKTWAEIGKWWRKGLTRYWFQYNSGRGNMSLVSSGKEKAGEWRCDAQTCREENSESFAGQHAPNATSFYIFDEASGVPDKIFDVREGGTTDGEPMVFDFGNGTRNSGKFFENCRGKFAHRYVTTEVDSRTVVITNKSRIRKWIEDYGVDSDFVKVRVRGMFPSLGSAQFIGVAEVHRAMNRPDVPHEVMKQYPLVLGVDCARFGDDESVIKPRCGPDARSFPARRYRNLDTVQLTAKIIECYNEFLVVGKKPAMIFVDAGNFGIAIVDNLRALGYPVTAVHFGNAANDSAAYRLVIDECYGRLKGHLNTGLVLPGVGEEATDLKTQMTQREFGYTLKDQINLESKRDMKDRLGNDIGSPDLADALAVTYFMDVREVEQRPATEITVWADGRPDTQPSIGSSLGDYDPWKMLG